MHFYSYLLSTLPQSGFPFEAIFTKLYKPIHIRRVKQLSVGFNGVKIINLFAVCDVGPLQPFRD